MSNYSCTSVMSPPRDGPRATRGNTGINFYYHSDYQPATSTDGGATQAARGRSGRGVMRSVRRRCVMRSSRGRGVMRSGRGLFLDDLDDVIVGHVVGDADTLRTVLDTLAPY